MGNVLLKYVNAVLPNKTVEYFATLSDIYIHVACLKLSHGHIDEYESAHTNHRAVNSCPPKTAHKYLHITIRKIPGSSQWNWD